MRKPDEGSSDTLGLPGGVRSALRASAAGPDLLKPLHMRVSGAMMDL
jgi:hypothetical protein